MNKAILVGNLTRDPEMRSLPSGIAVCTFTIAVNRRYTNQQGVREADFINIVTWRQTAELCGRYLTKGRKVGIIGSIQTRSYDAQDGTKKFVTEVVADEVEFIGSQGGQGRPMDDIPPPPEPGNYRGSEPANQRPPEQQGYQSSAPAAGGFAEVDDDELPF